MEQREVNVVVNVKTKNAKTNLKGVEKGLKDTQQQAVKTSDVINDQFSRMGGPLGGLINQVKSLGTSFKGIAVGVGVGAIAGITSLFVSATKRGAEFAKALSGLEAVTGATDAEMNQLSNSAKALGSSTQFTSKEVVGLQTEFAKLGFTTKEILNATKSTLDLAASLDIGLGEAASIAGSTLRAFGLETSETQRVVDVMASSTSSTALDFDALRESLKLVAPTSRAMGKSIEETTAMLGVLADNGLKGSIAGTGLSKTFIELNKKGIPLNEALKQVANSSNSLNTAIDLVGVVGSKSLLTLANNAPKIDTLTESFNNSAGAANELAETRLDNLAGDTTKLSSAWEGFLLSIEDGTGIFNTIARGIVQATTALLNFITPTKSLTDELKNQRFELNKNQTELAILDKTINDTSTSETELKKAQEKRKDIIIELKKQYPDYLKDIDAEKVTTEELNTAINAVNKSLIEKILIQSKEEQIQEQAAETAEYLNDLVEAENELTRQTTKVRLQYAKAGIIIKDSSPAGVIAELTRLSDEERDAINDVNKERQLYTGFNNDARKSIQSLVDRQKALQDAEEKYNSEQEKTNSLTIEKQKLMERLGITVDETTEKQDDANDAGGEAVEIETDLIKLLEKELELAKEMPGTTKMEIAARNSRIAAIQAEIDELKKLTLERLKMREEAENEIPKLQSRQQVEVNLDKTNKKEFEENQKRHHKNMMDEVERNKENLKKQRDDEKLGVQQLEDLKVQATWTTLTTIGSLMTSFAGENEKRQKRAFEFNKAVSIAATLVDTFQSAQSAYLSQLSLPTPDAPIRAKIAAGIATATGLANVAAIAAQRFRSPSKQTPSTGGDGGLDGGGVTETQAPQFNIVGQSGFNQIASALGQQQPVQAFVVAQDVTTAQQLNNNIISAATVGG